MRNLHRAATLLAFTSAYMAVVEATPHLLPFTKARSADAMSRKQLDQSGFLAVILTTSPALRPGSLAERVFLYATALWFLLAIDAAAAMIPEKWRPRCPDWSHDVSRSPRRLRGRCRAVAE